jgi:hypothetical protein
MRARLLLGACVFGLVSTPAYAQHFKVWAKAFIPNTGISIAEPVPGDNEHTMIPGPHLAGIPLDETCYNTNDRSFSDELDADAKISLAVDFDVYGPGVANVSHDIPEAGETIRYDCSSGAVVARGKAAVSDVSIGQVSYDRGIITFTFDGEAANPLISLPKSLVPAIKIHGTITIDTNKKTVQYVGTVAQFPSYEAYVSIDDASAIPIFEISPKSDATAWSLMLDTTVDETVNY